MIKNIKEKLIQVHSLLTCTLFAECLMHIVHSRFVFSSENRTWWNVFVNNYKCSKRCFLFIKRGDAERPFAKEIIHSSYICSTPLALPDDCCLCALGVFDDAICAIVNLASCPDNSPFIINSYCRDILKEYTNAQRYA